MENTNNMRTQILPSFLVAATNKVKSSEEPKWRARIAGIFQKIYNSSMRRHTQQLLLYMKGNNLYTHTTN